MTRNKAPRPASIHEVKARHESKIMKIPGVTGIAIGEQDSKRGLTIKVYVERMTPELRKRLPKKLGGYPVVTEPTGEFRAL